MSSFRQAEMYRLPAPPLNHHGVQEILSLLHLSVGITPFIVFVPRALYDQSIDKENLIYVSFVINITKIIFIGI